jgi:hypothetical protein
VDETDIEPTGDLVNAMPQNTTPNSGGRTCDLESENDCVQGE